MDHKQRPLVSVGMPVKNCRDTLRLSVRSLLAQTYRDWELLLIDDGSSDNTLQIARQFDDSRIKIFSDGKNQGLSSRLNQAVELSQGQYFARMDGDDIAYPTRLERQTHYLELHPEVDLLGSWVIVFGSGGTPLGKRAGPETHDAICAKPFAGFPIAHPTYVGHLDWFQRYRFNETLYRSQDQELLLRSYRFSRFANVPEILLGYRENRIDLRKALTGRGYFVRSLYAEFRRQKRFGLAIRAVVEQILKAIVDSIAIGSGLNYRMLDHRAQPITSAERDDWEYIWRLVMAQDANTAINSSKIHSQDESSISLSRPEK